MLFVVLLLVANYVGQVLYANNVGQLLYVVFAPSGGVSTTDGLHRPGVLCVSLCRGRKLKAPQRHIAYLVVDSYFHSDLLFLAVYLLCGGVLLFG